jgi:hypothetical protein
MSFRVTGPSRGHQAQVVAVERQMLSPHEVVEEAVVAVVVRIMVAAVVVVMVADEAQVQVVVGAATAAMHRVKHGKTNTRRDRRITIGNEGMTKR